MFSNRWTGILLWMLVPELVQCSEELEGWKKGDTIAVSCLDRSIDTGEHITNPGGELQYTPFFTCNETSKPLELRFKSDEDVPCTVQSLTDSAYHLLEFYVHNDVPMTCRVRSTPNPSTKTMQAAAASQEAYIPIVFALSGALSLSHLHVNPEMNVLMHIANAEGSIGREKITAASSYSSPALVENSTRVIIGDPLRFLLHVRWYSSAAIPSSVTNSPGLGGHVHLSTFFYCLVSYGAGIAVSLAYFRGIELPQRLRTYGKERLGGERGTGYAFPGTAFVSSGALNKRD